MEKMINQPKRAVPCKVVGYGTTGTKTKVRQVMEQEGKTESQAVVTIIDRYFVLMAFIEKGDIATFYKTAAGFKG